MAQTYLCDVCDCGFDGSATPLAIRLGLNRGKPFVGFVAIKQCWVSGLPMAVLGLGLLAMVEMFRVFIPRLMRAESQERRHIFSFLTWFVASIYGIYRNTRWLYMYLNELWFVILVTQVFLTATDGFCFIALWSGAVQPTSSASSDHVDLDAVVRGGLGEGGRKHKGNWRVQQVVVVFKLWHLFFFIVEVVHSVPKYGVLETLFGDDFRNVTFLAEDLLYLRLFFVHDELLANLKCKRIWVGAAAMHLIYLGTCGVLIGRDYYDVMT